MITWIIFYFQYLKGFCSSLFNQPFFKHDFFYCVFSLYTSRHYYNLLFPVVFIYKNKKNIFYIYIAIFILYLYSINIYLYIYIITIYIYSFIYKNKKRVFWVWKTFVSFFEERLFSYISQSAIIAVLNCGESCWQWTNFWPRHMLPLCNKSYFKCYFCSSEQGHSIQKAGLSSLHVAKRYSVIHLGIKSLLL